LLISNLATSYAQDLRAADTDVAVFRQQIEKEASAAMSKGMNVQLTRRSSEIIATIVEERISRGNYPSAEALVAEAVERAFT